MTDQPEADQPQDVPPGPVPTAFAVVTVQNPAGESMVLLRVSTPMGAGFYFLEPETAVQVGNALRANGKAGIRPKLHTPPSGLVVPELRPA
jgi:hypothetical protein